MSTPKNASDSIESEVLVKSGDFRSFFDNKYLGPWDVPEDSNELILTIDEVYHVEVTKYNSDDETEHKLRIHFKETEFKPFLCSKKNGGYIADALDSYDIEAWPGEKIIITTVMKDVFGEMRNVLSVKNKAPKQMQELTALHPSFPKVVEAVKDGNTTRKGLEKNWIISDAIWQDIEDEAGLS